jgi:hypothetical protein
MNGDRAFAMDWPGADYWEGHPEQVDPEVDEPTIVEKKPT